MFLENISCFFCRYTNFCRNEFVFSRHELTDGQVVIFCFYKTDIAIGKNADKFSAFIGDWHTADVIRGHDLFGFAERRIGLQTDRFNNHPRLRTLDLFHFGGLRVGWHVTVDDAESAFACKCNGKSRFCYSIHRGGEDRDVELNRRRELDFYICFIRQYFGVTRDDEDVVEGEGVVAVKKFFVHRVISLFVK